VFRTAKDFLDRQVKGFGDILRDAGATLHCPYYLELADADSSIENDVFLFSALLKT